MSDTTQRRVVCAALRNADGLVICGPRHYDKVMRQQIQCSTSVRWKNGDVEQGFVDQFGAFMTREQALAVAVMADQIVRRCGGDDHELFSENLY